jgi:TonB-dependent receptor
MVLLLLLVNVLSGWFLAAEERKGAIAGHVADANHNALQGARVELQPQERRTISDSQGQFTISDLAPGNYTVLISYMGFSPFAATVSVTEGQVARVDAVLEKHQQEITVHGERLQGEAAAINRERAADNILQVLPAEVITSLPNANVADAVGRLPSVTLERDEGEGKYVQIRGTEPRLSNVTIEGVNVPSAESTVRQIKLDAIPASLLESVEINKTLQANMDADGIGGSVNLKIKNAGDQPYLAFNTLGGYTPIIGGRGIMQGDATMGQRFGASKKLGVLFGATYDYNGRGINDIEPVPTPGSATPHYDSIDLRDYMYYRTRWGLAGSVDYKLGNLSSIYLKGFYSDFKDYGNKWVYTLNDGGNPQFSQDWRRPDYTTAFITAGGKHVFNSSWFAWDLSATRAVQTSGFGGANYAWNPANPAANCADDPALTTDIYRPQFTPSCFTPGNMNALDRSNYILSRFQLPVFGRSPQLNLQGSASFAKNYHLAHRFGTFELGFKIRNAHKFDDTYTDTWVPNPAVSLLASQWPNGFTDSNYYDKSYPFGNAVDYNKVKAFALTNPGLFNMTSGPGINSANYNLIERVTAGYLMNTIDLSGRLRLITGVRFEATHVETLSFDASTGLLSANGGGDYLDTLPSVALRISVTPDSGLRLVASRALARPNPADIAQAVGLPDTTQNPPTISFGNPALKAEHSNNFDILYEHYLKPLGMIQAGFFYKLLTDPIITTQVTPTSGAYAGYLVTQPINAGRAHLTGFEAAYQQHLRFLPGGLSGLGVSANYSYTTSRTWGIPGRSDHPALLRQAPHTFNISPTYDRGPVSLRVGMTYNAANIFAYQWQDNADPTGIHGPSGDNYLYSHFQLDAQASIRIHQGLRLIVSGLNLNNEPFGFYNGSSQYVVQREYYHPTIAAGLRWTPLTREDK